jgi:hypothetical protein
MQKIAEQQPSRKAVNVSETLSRVGFNLQLLGSTKHVEERLQALTKKQLANVKEAFIQNNHPRFMKEFGACENMAFVKKTDYVRNIDDADLPKMAKLIRIVGILLQSKVYLFWRSAHGVETSRSGEASFQRNIC